MVKAYIYSMHWGVQVCHIPTNGKSQGLMKATALELSGSQERDNGFYEVSIKVFFLYYSQDS